MTHEIHTVVAFDIVGPHQLRVEFGDGSAREIDFRPVLKGEVYGPLNDLDVFNRVRVDQEVKTLVWPNGADFDPATLHDWPRQGAALAELARQWARTGTGNE